MMCFHTLHHASVLDIGSELVDLGFPTLDESVDDTEGMSVDGVNYYDALIILY